MKRTLASAPAPPPAAPDCLPALGRLLRYLDDHRTDSADAHFVAGEAVRAIVDRAHGRDERWFPSYSKAGEALIKILGSK